MTSSALPDLDSALSALAVTPRLLVCCDFDGTISTLADEPSEARPVEGAVAVLASLAALPDTWASVMSGRALIDLTQLAGMPSHVHLVGSHGTEFELGSIVAIGPTEDALVATVATRCQEIVAGVPGTLVEVKPASVAVHVRRADRRDAQLVLSAVRAGPGRIPGVHVIEGKEVVELAVFPGTKGDGLNALRSRWNITSTLFVGDDTTDEFAFSALTSGDLGVKVGPGSSVAPWTVSDPTAVVRLLEHLLELRAASNWISR